MTSFVAITPRQLSALADQREVSLRRRALDYARSELGLGPHESEGALNDAFDVSKDICLRSSLQSETARLTIFLLQFLEPTALATDPGLRSILSETETPDQVRLQLIAEHLRPTRPDAEREP